MTARALTPEQETAVVERYKDGLSLRRLAKEYDVAVATIAGALERAGVERRSGSPAARFTISEAKQVRAEYEAGASLGELRDRYGCFSRDPIKRAILSSGGEIRRRGNAVRQFTPEHAAEMAAMWEAGASQTRIAAPFNSSQVTISRVLALHGYEMETRLQRGEGHGFWKGGRTVTATGYVHVRPPLDDELANAMRNTTGYVPEHRLVMARALGRPLRKDETVHHVNGVRDDNRLENLQLMQGGHGKGVVMRCAECGSLDVHPFLLDDELKDGSR